jgi:hypothetical protein
MGDAMDLCARLRRSGLSAIVTIAVGAGVAGAADQAAPQTAGRTSQAASGAVVRGCLAGSKLTAIVSDDPKSTLPDTLRVRSIRVIRSQLKTLDGHQVELTGTLQGIPGQDNGVLVVDSDKGKVYIGGGDTSLGEDFGTARIEPPTIYAHTIRDIAPACTANQSK